MFCIQGIYPSNIFSTECRWWGSKLLGYDDYESHRRILEILWIWLSHQVLNSYKYWYKIGRREIFIFEEVTHVQFQLDKKLRRKCPSFYTVVRINGEFIVNLVTPILIHALIGGKGQNRRVWDNIIIQGKHLNLLREYQYWLIHMGMFIS